MKVILSVCAAWALMTLPLFATAQTLASGTSEGHSWQVEEVTRGFGVPWGLSFVSQDQVFVTQRTGEAMLVDVHSGTTRAVSGLPEVAAQGQGGLLDVATAPDFATSGWLYFTYSKPREGGAATTLARAQLVGTRLEDWQDLLVTDSVTRRGQHFGSRIAFDEDGHVFFGIGDRGERDEAQDPGNHIGTIIRLHLDGSIPADNPFVGNPEVRDEIWSFGHRNPQGMAFDAVEQRLWSNEHGPRGGDEINRIQPGLNYGWPEVSLGREYWGPIDVGADADPQMEDPVVVFTPSIAPGSLMVYRGEAFPQWHGNLISGALVLTHLNRVVLDDNLNPVTEERLLENLGERIRAITTDHQGWLYLSTDSGRLLRLRPA
ncbi:MAG: PQQ-dependent sugar dehydrogenase [Saccharospirillum sp.]